MLFPCILQYENSYSISIKCDSNPPSYKVDKMIDKCQIISRNLRCIIKFKEDTYNKGKESRSPLSFFFLFEFYCKCIPENCQKDSSYKWISCDPSVYWLLIINICYKQNYEPNERKTCINQKFFDNVML